MSVSYLKAQTHKIRITLELQVLPDFEARNINWEKLFDLEPCEKVKAYVEDFNDY
jgi:hypothetical protein